MKPIIYISGILGGLLFIIWTFGIFLEFPNNNLILYSSLLVLLLVFFPLMMIDRIRQNRKIDEIIQSYEGSDHDDQTVKEGADDSVRKGWGMNNSPFRTRKSGLTWGGGNVKGANATRGKRKKFLG
jgi:hypothetical protein